MPLTDRQLAAFVKAGTSMIAADGRILGEEKKILDTELTANGCLSRQSRQAMLKAADSMLPAEMIAILSGLDDSDKRRLAGFLAAIMIIDGDIDSAEIKLWKLTCTLAGCPSMTISEALEYWEM